MTAGASPTVSVVIPTWNRAWCLPRAIASVLAQTHPVLELIVVDDGSTDDTPAVVAAVADPRVRYLRLPGGSGVSRARNAGTAAARGQWIAFQDSDDEWLPDKLERQMAAAADDVALLLCGCDYPAAPHRSFPRVVGGEWVDFTAQVGARIPGAPCFVAPRHLLDEVGGFDPVLDCFEDWELALRLAERGRVRFVNRTLVLAGNTAGGLFSADRGYARNLKHIAQRHGERLRRDRAAWAYYCNLIGQGECQTGATAEGRRWFCTALSERPWYARTWVNLAMSFAGPAAFDAYLRAARSLHRRFVRSPPLRIGD